MNQTLEMDGKMAQFMEIWNQNDRKRLKWVLILLYIHYQDEK